MLLKDKGEAAGRLKEWKVVVENERGLKLVSLRTENEGSSQAQPFAPGSRKRGSASSLLPLAPLKQMGWQNE